MTALGDMIRAAVADQRNRDRQKPLHEMPIDQLKALWDRYDGCNAPDGYDGEDIHAVLNMRGEGRYCAV